VQANIVTAYSVSYLFGLVTVVLFTSQIAPLLLRVNLRDEAERLWRALGGDSALAEGQRLAAPSLVAREVSVTGAADLSVDTLEGRYGNELTVARRLWRRCPRLVRKSPAATSPTSMPPPSTSCSRGAKCMA
jgi:putative transport protein